MIVHITVALAFLASAALLLGADQVVRGWGTPKTHGSIERQPPPALPAPLETSETVRTSVYATMRSRPLFSPTRRPFVARPDRQTTAAPAASKTSGPQPPQASLLGVVSQGEDGLAVLSLHRTGTTIYVKIGDNVEGWRVDMIDKDRVVFSNGSQTEIIELY